MLLGCDLVLQLLLDVLPLGGESVDDLAADVVLHSLGHAFPELAHVLRVPDGLRDIDNDASEIFVLEPSETHNVDASAASHGHLLIDGKTPLAVAVAGVTSARVALESAGRQGCGNCSFV